MSNQVKINFLIDTGADISLLPADIFKADTRNVSRNLVSANGGHIQTFGSRTLTFRLGSFPKSFSWTFIIAQVRQPILGSDFLADAGISVNCKYNSLTLGDHTTHGSPKGTEAKTNETRIHHLSMPCLEIRTTREPIAQKARRISGKVPESVQTEYAELLKLGVIRRSTSLWASPLIIVKKKDSTFRPCEDYFMLISFTIPGKYPLPRISDILDRISASSIFPTIYLKKANYQIHIHDSDIPINYVHNTSRTI